MCLGIPGQIISIAGDTATVDFWGTLKQVRVDAIDVTLATGDHIISHVGVAVRRVAAEDVADTYALYEAVLSEAGETRSRAPFWPTRAQEDPVQSRHEVDHGHLRTTPTVMWS